MKEMEESYNKINKEFNICKEKHNLNDKEINNKSEELTKMNIELNKYKEENELKTEEINKLKNEIDELKNNLEEIQEKYEKIDNYEKEINELKENKMLMFNELNQYEEQCTNYEKQINELKEKRREELIFKIENERLKKELEDTNQKMINTNDENKKLIDKFHEEAMNAKLKLANDNYQNQEETMKLKRQVKRLSVKLEGMGVNINQLK